MHICRVVSGMSMKFINMGVSGESVTNIYRGCQKSNILIYRRVPGHFINDIYGGMSRHSVNSKIIILL